LNSGKLFKKEGFSNVRAGYWSSTTIALNTGAAWEVRVTSGDVGTDLKTHTFYYVWPVRAGQ